MVQQVSMKKITDKQFHWNMCYLSKNDSLPKEIGTNNDVKYACR